ncbi:hypothetical protein [Streptomyces sp. NL15-2K]|uniref:hypothetical protein n=1 Tax=Streptomyces sp. NL15-2K TaxID=376149 RepID=UPI000F589354|nr:MULTISPECIES: hypothetical protein [Actinomycetes]WKX09058.1 hypothetical protein Q4V64_16765 [Kutzneria buriramensis]GCB49444.1 hypothetical protein SNL152K_6781 [Streptomyces sp. NL15-2K]
MNETIARRLTGLAGIAAAVALIVEVPLYFIYSGPPPDANVLSRVTNSGPIGLGFLGVAVILPVSSGLLRLLRDLSGRGALCK